MPSFTPDRDPAKATTKATTASSPEKATEPSRPQAGIRPATTPLTVTISNPNPHPEDTVRFDASLWKMLKDAATANGVGNITIAVEHESYMPRLRKFLINKKARDRGSKAFGQMTMKQEGLLLHVTLPLLTTYVAVCHPTSFQQDAD